MTAAGQLGILADIAIGLPVVTTFVVFVALAVAGIRKFRPHFRCVGELCLAELPGMLSILLAGPEYWKAAGRILERRAAKPSTPIADAYYQQGKHTARDLMYDLMGPLPGGYGPRRVSCLRCGAPHPLVSGHCGPCYEYRLRRRGNPN